MALYLGKAAEIASRAAQRENRWDYSTFDQECFETCLASASSIVARSVLGMT